MLARRGSARRIDLHDRADHHEMPVRARRRGAPASSAMSSRSSSTPKKPTRGAGIAAWSAGSGRGSSRPREVRDVDAARKRVDVGVQMRAWLDTGCGRR